MAFGIPTFDAIKKAVNAVHSVVTNPAAAAEKARTAVRENLKNRYHSAVARVMGWIPGNPWKQPEADTKKEAKKEDSTPLLMSEAPANNPSGKLEQLERKEMADAIAKGINTLRQGCGLKAFGTTPQLQASVSDKAQRMKNGPRSHDEVGEGSGTLNGEGEVLSWISFKEVQQKMKLKGKDLVASEASSAAAELLVEMLRTREHPRWLLSKDYKEAAFDVVIRWEDSNEMADGNNHVGRTPVFCLVGRLNKGGKPEEKIETADQLRSRHPQAERRAIDQIDSQMDEYESNKPAYAFEAPELDNNLKRHLAGSRQRKLISSFAAVVEDIKASGEALQIKYDQEATSKWIDQDEQKQEDSFCIGVVKDGRTIVYKVETARIPLYFKRFGAEKTEHPVLTSELIADARRVLATKAQPTAPSGAVAAGDKAPTSEPQKEGSGRREPPEEIPDSISDVTAGTRGEVDNLVGSTMR
ncbi:MAG: hypothetical protein Q8P95_05320 [bacterium]|nr:hypothetical protein [bacterium]